MNVLSRAHSGSPNPAHHVTSSLPVTGGQRGAHKPDQSLRIVNSYHLVSQQEDGLETELPRAEVEEVFQAGPQQLHHHDVVVPFRPAPPDGGDAHWKTCAAFQGGRGQKTLTDLGSHGDSGQGQVDREMQDRGGGAGKGGPGGRVAQVPVIDTLPSVHGPAARGAHRTQRWLSVTSTTTCETETHGWD